MASPPPADETPMQRALRLKKAAAAAAPKPRGADKVRRDSAAGIAAGRSKPWMTR